MQEVTPEQRADVILKMVSVVGDTIRDLGEVPSGHLYARLMAYMDIHTYNTIIGVLVKAGKVRNRNHLLTWVEGRL